MSIYDSMWSELSADQRAGYSNKQDFKSKKRDYLAEQNTDNTSSRLDSLNRKISNMESKGTDVTNAERFERLNARRDRQIEGGDVERRSANHSEAADKFNAAKNSGVATGEDLLSLKADVSAAKSQSINKRQVKEDVKTRLDAGESMVDINESYKDNDNLRLGAQKFLNKQLNSLTGNPPTDVTDPKDGTPVMDTVPELNVGTTTPTSTEASGDRAVINSGIGSPAVASGDGAVATSGNSSAAVGDGAFSNSGVMNSMNTEINVPSLSDMKPGIGSTGSSDTSVSNSVNSIANNMKQNFITNIKGNLTDSKFEVGNNSSFNYAGNSSSSPRLRTLDTALAVPQTDTTIEPSTGTSTNTNTNTVLNNKVNSIVNNSDQSITSNIGGDVTGSDIRIGNRSDTNIAGKLSGNEWFMKALGK